MSGLSHSGTVQVYREDGWISVCGDSDWDGADAQVVCARLGYNQARVVTQSTSRVSSRWMRRVRCVGNESSLLDCPHQIISYGFCTPANIKCLNCEYTHMHTHTAAVVQRVNMFVVVKYQIIFTF